MIGLLSGLGEWLLCMCFSMSLVLIRYIGILMFGVVVVLV